jgi:hypothetical protein
MAAGVHYSDDLADRICGDIADGFGLRDLCQQDWCPSRTTVYSWISSNEMFRRKYEAALLLRAEFWSDEIVSIADDGSNDWIERTLKNGSTVRAVDKECVERSKLRVHVRLRLMAALNPQKYGERVQQDINYPDADAIAERLNAGRARVLQHQAQRALPGSAVTTPFQVIEGTAQRED